MRMSYDKVASTDKEKCIIGTKQTMKALKNSDIELVIIATDADCNVTDKVLDLAREQNVPICHVNSMKKLGKSCGIEVGAATVAIVKG